jgi:glyoxylase-like metal-dependent hydrolase (beta-lactamase superfamily II)
MYRTMRATIVAVATLVSAPALAADPFTMEWKELAKGVWVGVRPVSYRTPVLCNTVVVIGKKGVLVFDAAGFAIQGERLVEKVAELTDKPITQIVVSHWHGDHSNGLHKVLEKYPDAQVISHSFTAKAVASPLAAIPPRDLEAESAYRERVKKTLATGIRSNGDPLTPSLRKSLEDSLEYYDAVNEQVDRMKINVATVFADSLMKIDLGGKKVELRHIAPGNTRGDLFLWLPKEKILATGDIVVSPTPYGFFSYPQSWSGVLRDLKKFPARYIVPGHGDVMTDTSYLDLLAETMDLVVAEVDPPAKAGKSLEEVRAEVAWTPVEARFTGGDDMLAFIFNIWFKTPIVEAEYNLAIGKDNESLEAPQSTN